MKEFIPLALQLLLAANVESWNEGSVLLRDVQVVTLYKGRYTTARRSSPVPQLQCAGGSAGCGAFIPEVVQCQNKGWDGVDVQWECRTDMDNAYRFGHIELNCEGYSHPDDSYVLKGSCGLEYTLELTEEGKKRTRGNGDSHHGFKNTFGGFGDFASSFFSGFSSNKHHHHHDNRQRYKSSSPLASEDSGSFLVVGLFLLLAFGVYKLFLSGNTTPTGQGGNQDGYPGENPTGYSAGPPPPGFKPEFAGSTFGYPGANPGYGFRSQYSQRHPNPWGSTASGTGGGFWTGLGTGGMLGYLFGRQSRPYTNNQAQYHDSGPAFPRNTTFSTGTRTASGFGGTKRR
ncbi:store-operated calcium entry-associated regulatory factor isoform X2 [Lampris incognitus]|uniref:store-operated calcium entry-associated regulatory factor isoform X2 n=1 Tax=Lampris incognitus TaxID=2546036 RepID=UPI0024B57EEB|nr:store-operated calcium entry-associated regulatory factor isoform X2 [Lampris incognitus]